MVEGQELVSHRILAVEQRLSLLESKFEKLITSMVRLGYIGVSLLAGNFCFPWFSG